MSWSKGQNYTHGPIATIILIKQFPPKFVCVVGLIPSVPLMGQRSRSRVTNYRISNFLTILMEPIATEFGMFMRVDPGCHWGVKLVNNQGQSQSLQYPGLLVTASPNLAHVPSMERDRLSHWDILFGEGHVNHFSDARLEIHKVDFDSSQLCALPSF
jgi:hypothetical protein